MLLDAVAEPPDAVELVVAREDDALDHLLLPRLPPLGPDLLLLPLDEHEPGEDVGERLLREDVLPHVFGGEMARDDRVPGAGVDPFAAALVERDEGRPRPAEGRRHPCLVHVDREVDERPRLRLEQPRHGAPLRAVLLDGVVVGLPACLALHFDRRHREAVHEDHMVDDLAFARPDFARDGEDVLPPRGGHTLLERRVRRRIEEGEVDAAHRNAVTEGVDESAALRDAGEVHRLGDGFVALGPVEARELLHRLRLRRLEELDEEALVHRVVAAVVRVRPQPEALLGGSTLREAPREEALVVLFVHEFLPVHERTSFLPVVYSAMIVFFKASSFSNCPLRASTTASIRAVALSKNAAISRCSGSGGMGTDKLRTSE